jgi:hypothetical protein
VRGERKLRKNKQAKGDKRQCEDKCIERTLIVKNKRWGKRQERVEEDNMDSDSQ